MASRQLCLLAIARATSLGQIVAPGFRATIRVLSASRASVALIAFATACASACRHGIRFCWWLPVGQWHHPLLAGAQTHGSRFGTFQARDICLQGVFDSRAAAYEAYHIPTAPGFFKVQGSSGGFHSLDKACDRILHIGPTHMRRIGSNLPPTKHWFVAHMSRKQLLLRKALPAS